jgi:hypothetical protein
MSREEIQKLLGGYATDTLSEAERSALFAAALGDQELFDALAKEQALREVLHDPAARHQLLVALRPSRIWLRRPAVLAMAGCAAGILIVAGLLLWQKQHAVRHEIIVADAVARGQDTLQTSPVPRKVFQPPAAHLAKKVAPLPPPPQLKPAAQPASSALNSVVVEAESRTVPMAEPRAAPPRDARLQVSAAAVAVVRPSVPYTLLVRGSDGTYAQLPAGAVIHVGDSVRIQAEPGGSGFIHLFRRGDAGWSLVSSQGVVAGQRYVLPSAGGVESDSATRIELLLLLSSVEHADAEDLAGVQAVSRVTVEYR